MKFRNNWNNRRPNWKTINIRLRMSLLDLFSLEIDPKREFYSVTILNLTLKNR
jgi:hypothetical protein